MESNEFLCIVNKENVYDLLHKRFNYDKILTKLEFRKLLVRRAAKYER